MDSAGVGKAAERKVVITNSSGLHARPATQIAELANKFNSEIYIHKDELKVNAKSVMEVLLLAATAGTELLIKAVGDDAEEAVKAIAELIESGFSEQ